MADNDALTLRIRVIAATKAGLAKTISGLQNFAKQVRTAAGRASAALSSFKGRLPRINVTPALNSLRGFARKARGIVGSAFTGMARFGARFARNIARSVARGVKSTIVSLAALGAWSVKTASWAEEMEAKFDVVFGNMAKEAKKWAEEFGKAVNRSKFSVMGFMASMQDLFVPMGFTRKAASELSKEFVKLGVDLASFNNVTDEVALEKLQSALTGMYRPLRDMGILLTDEKVKLKAVELGLATTTKKVSDQAMTMARLKLIQEMSKDAQDDAIRTAGSFANRMKGLRERFKDLRIEMGRQIIEGGALNDLIAKMTSKIGGLIRWFRETGALRKWGATLRDWLNIAYERLKPLAKDIKDLFSQDPEVRKKAFEDIKTRFVNAAKKFGEIVVPYLIKAAEVIGGVIARIIIEELGKYRKTIKEEGIIGTVKRKPVESGIFAFIALQFSAAIAKFVHAVGGAGTALKKLVVFLGELVFGKSLVNKLISEGIKKEVAQKIVSGKHIVDPAPGKAVARTEGVLVRWVKTFFRTLFVGGANTLTKIFGVLGAKVLVLASGIATSAALVYQAIRNNIATVKLQNSMRALQEQEAKFGSATAAKLKRLQQNEEIRRAQRQKVLENVRKNIVEGTAILSPQERNFMEQFGVGALLEIKEQQMKTNELLEKIDKDLGAQ